MKFYKNLKSALLYLSVLAIFLSFAMTVSVHAQGGKDGGDSQNNENNNGKGQGNGIGNGNSNSNSNSDSNSNRNSSTNDMQVVLQLFKQNRFAEAVPYLERLVKADPNDADLRFLYGFALLMKSKNAANKNEARQLQILARNEFVKSKQLGSKEEVIDKLIASLPKDGDVSDTDSTTNSTNNSPSFSNNKDAQEYMEKGEAYFARGEYDKAFEMYEKALKKDPNLYEAALFSGDAFLKMGDDYLKQNNTSKQKESYDKAETWYQKAMIINPNRETAYRYSATPLMRLKQYEKARDRYVEAYITEPYNERALTGLKQWAEVTSTEIGHPVIEIPADVSSTGNTNVTVGNTDDGSFAWSGYAVTRASWQSGRDGLSEKFKKTYPNETTYRRSLAEEFDALRATVVILKERMSSNDNSIKKLNPQLATLVKLYDEGLLESYILLAIKDNGIAQDQANYLKQNREKMRQYVLKYVVDNS
ncbi:hypothetical protein BH10ACI1_BH10ACI1_01320 [soil metagenome]